MSEFGSESGNEIDMTRSVHARIRSFGTGSGHELIDEHELRHVMIAVTIGVKRTLHVRSTTGLRTASHSLFRRRAKLANSAEPRPSQGCAVPSASIRFTSDEVEKSLGLLPHV
jgi:hypothetical protein